jgi:hypothetical protein
MIVVGEAARAAGRRIDVPIQNGTRLAGKTDWLESGKDASLSPSVFLVELPPGSVLDTHFHRENQFQLFVTGEGRIGPHPIRPITVHYAGAFTGYGPLAAGPEGLSYFTIRPVYDTGAFYLPHARGDMVNGPKRNLHSAPAAPLDAKALRALPAPELVDLIALQPDHIAARLLRLPARTSHVDLDPREAEAVPRGRHWIDHARRHALGPLDMIFVSADESPFRLEAREDGAEVILLQLPLKAEAYVGHGWSHSQKTPETIYDRLSSSTACAWSSSPPALPAVATMILAQLGADVVKIESPDGDDARLWPPHIGDRSIVYRNMSVGKRGVVIDLKNAEGVEVALAARSATVVLQTMRPGVADRIGIGAAAVRAGNPDVIYYDMNAFGTGPVGRAMPGYDPMAQAFTGIMEMTGHEGSPPTRCAPSLIDLGTGMWIAMGILAAVLARQRGQKVSSLETALVDTAFSVVCYQATTALMTGERPPRAGSGNPIAAPYQCYEASDAPFMLAAGNQKIWLRVVDVLCAPELAADPRFTTGALQCEPPRLKWSSTSIREVDRRYRRQASAASVRTRLRTRAGGGQRHRKERRTFMTRTACPGAATVAGRRVDSLGVTGACEDAAREVARTGPTSASTLGDGSRAETRAKMIPTIDRPHSRVPRNVPEIRRSTPAAEEGIEPTLRSRAGERATCCAKAEELLPPLAVDRGTA